MAFVNAYLTEEDKKFIASFKFHNPIGRLNELAPLPEEWSIDRRINTTLYVWADRENLIVSILLIIIS